MTLGDTSQVLVVGYGLHGQAVAAATTRRGIDTVVVDDRPSDRGRAHAANLGLELVEAPDASALERLVGEATHGVPTPGLPEHHPFFALATAAGLTITGDFGLAAEWDHRPIVAITGTNGKTTVTTMVTAMLQASGRAAVMAGNMDLPLVTAVDDPDPELFVVEASSFRLGHADRFSPAVGTWLNIEPDHLDVHADMAAYEAAKARIWAHQPPDGVAIGNADDAAVMAHMPGRASDLTFGRCGDARVLDGELVVRDTVICRVDELARSLPHDIANALAAAATTLAAGGSVEAVRDVLISFAGLEHRVELIAEHGGVRWYNDSKATTPHAVLAGVGGFDTAVLIAGGRNKGVDLTPLRALVPAVHAVVAIGDDAADIEAVFADLVPVTTAGSMTEAVAAAAHLSQPGDAVVLSPACTSYDWYSDYGARGHDFARIVREHVGRIDPEVATP